MIRDRAAYERLRVAEEHRALRELDMASSIAKLEALLSSSLLNRVEHRHHPRPLNLVRSIGIEASGRSTSGLRTCGSRSAEAHGVVKRASSQTFVAFCRKAIDFLNSSATPYLVIGGIAVGAVGEPRMTSDVNVIAYLSMGKAIALIDAAAAAGFEVAPDERGELQATGTLRFCRGRFQLDIILASLPCEDDARARSHEHCLFDRMVLLPTPEDLILFKVLAGRDKDLVDAVGVARRHRAKLDRSYLQGAITAVCELAEDLTPLRRLEEVLRKASSDLP